MYIKFIEKTKKSWKMIEIQKNKLEKEATLVQRHIVIFELNSIKMLPKGSNRLSNVLVKLSKILYTVKNNKVSLIVL